MRPHRKTEDPTSHKRNNRKTLPIIQSHLWDFHFIFSRDGFAQTLFIEGNQPPSQSRLILDLVFFFFGTWCVIITNHMGTVFYFGAAIPIPKLEDFGAVPTGRLMSRVHFDLCTS